MAAEAEALNSVPQDSEKRFFSLGTAETKKQAKKGKEQRKKRKRKAGNGMYITCISVINHYKITYTFNFIKRLLSKL